MKKVRKSVPGRKKESASPQEGQQLREHKSECSFLSEVGGQGPENLEPHSKETNMLSKP